MKNSVGIRYLLILVFTIFGFTNFVACGAKMYKMSLEEDSHALTESQAQLPAESSNDPSSEYYGIHALDGWTHLPILFKTDRKLTPEEKAGLKNAMTKWEKAVGKKLFDYSGPDKLSGDLFKNLFSSLDDQVNGFYADSNWKKTKKSSMVLATTIWNNSKDNPNAISSADIHFNEEYYLIGDAFTAILPAADPREIVDMETLALHELGHLIGLTHVSEEVDPTSIMNPSLYIGEGLANRKISIEDLVRVQKIYGCQGNACDLEATLEEINTPKTAEFSTSIIR